MGTRGIIEAEHGVRPQVLFVGDADWIVSAAAAFEADYDVRTKAALGDREREKLAEEAVCIVADDPDLSVLAAVRDVAPELPFILYGDESAGPDPGDAVDGGATGYVPRAGPDGNRRLLEHEIERAIADCRARERLDEQEVWYRALIERSSGLVVVLDAEGRRQYVSPSMRSVTGYDPEEMIGHDAFELIHPDDRPQFEAAFEGLKRLPEGASIDLSYRYRHADDTWHRHESIVTNRLDDPVVKGVIYNVRDVTEEREREQELEQYETIVETMLDGVYVLDADERFVQVNDAFARMTGYTADELIGSHASLVVDGELVRTASEPKRQGVDEQVSTATISGAIHAKDGGIVTAENQVSPIRFADGSVGRIGVVRDVTERFERERVLKRYETIIETVGDGIYVLDADERFVQVNDAFAALTEYSREELLGEHALLVVEEEDLTDLSEIERSIRDGSSKAAVIEETIFTKGERPVPIENRLTLVRHEDGSYGRAGVIRDITERKRREQEIEASRRRYRELLETAPDAICVADAETGDIVEANEAASTLFGRPPEEIVGMNQTELHPPAQVDRYRRLFERHVNAGEGLFDRFPDGSDVFAVNADGERIPIEVRARVIDLDDRTLIVGIFRDVSEQRRHERTLTALHESTRDLLRAENHHDIAQVVVDAASDVLDISGVAVYLFDPEANTLVPSAFTRQTDDVTELATLGPESSITWQAFVEGASIVLDDITNSPQLFNDDTPMRSGMYIPLGDHGVLIAEATDGRASDPQTVELADLLAASAEVALDRATRTVDLAKRTQELAKQERHLDRLYEVNEKVRRIEQAIVRAETREEVYDAVCEQLLATGRFSFAWVGEPDPITDELHPQTWAGDDRGYLDAIEASEDGWRAEPAGLTAEAGSLTLVSQIEDGHEDEAWRAEAVERGFGSAISVPIVYDGVLYGILSVYTGVPSGFDELSRATFAELGSGIGYVINAAETKQTLLTDSVVELDVEIRNANDPLVRLARRIDATIEIRDVVADADAKRTFFVVRGSDPDEVLAAADEVADIEAIQLVADRNDEQFFQATVVGPTIASTVVNHGGAVETVTADASDARLGVALHRGADVRGFITFLRERYPDTTLLARRNRTRTAERSRVFRGELDERLTERQRQALRTAYFGGYFESPRASTGQEISAALDISQPTFIGHLRTGERKVFELLFDE